jgi:hypothetical protein
MSYKKIRTFSIFLLLGIATLFVPVTALQNSIAMAQEYYNIITKNMKKMETIMKNMIPTKMIIIKMLQ